MLGGRQVVSVARRLASTLVMAEQSGGEVSPGTLAAVSAALKVGGECVVMADSAEGAEASSRIEGISKVLLCPSASAKTIAGLVDSTPFTHVVYPSSTKAKDAMPRVAAAMDRSPVAEIVDVVDETTFVRPMYAGNALATVKATLPTVLSVRATAFDKAGTGEGRVEVENVENASPSKHAPKVLSSARGGSADKVDLTSAKSVVSGGRGMKSGENFKLLEDLAKKLDTAAVGASRAAVDAGMVPNDLQVGQTGKVVAPQLYMAVGISGAIQHLSGMKDSKVIVAINKDPEAPIFQVADYGLVKDLFDAVPEITEKV